MVWKNLGFMVSILIGINGISTASGAGLGLGKKVSNLVAGSGSLLFNDVASLSFLGTLPQDNPDNIRFYLYPNPQDLNETQEIVYGNTSTLQELKFRLGSPWKFIVHGFIQNAETGFPQSVKNAYLKRMRATNESLNIVIVDWGQLAYESESGVRLPLYDRAVRNVIPTGDRVAALISFLMSNSVITTLDQVHLIGQSLGAHVVGEAGNALKTFYKKTVPRITGLDPAGPLFYTTVASRQLETSDGDFVDVYHCNPGAYGIDRSIGDVEFYVNIHYFGERIQPQCEEVRSEVEDPALCSHNYCPKFFALSIIRNIIGEKCEGRAVLGFDQTCSNETVIYGEDVPKGATGEYFADVTDNLDDVELFM